MSYHGISEYQFYTALKLIDGGEEPPDSHGNSELDRSREMQETCGAYLERICRELAEDLPVGFRMELSQRVQNILYCNLSSRCLEVIFSPCLRMK
jgi:hypothetical protein